jgi:hypothetical protein
VAEGCPAGTAAAGRGAVTARPGPGAAGPQTPQGYLQQEDPAGRGLADPCRQGAGTGDDGVDAGVGARAPGTAQPPQQVSLHPRQRGHPVRRPDPRARGARLVAGGCPAGTAAAARAASDSSPVPGLTISAVTGATSAEGCRASEFWLRIRHFVRSQPTQGRRPGPQAANEVRQTADPAEPVSLRSVNTATLTVSIVAIVIAAGSLVYGRRLARASQTSAIAASDSVKSSDRSASAAEESVKEARRSAGAAEHSAMSAAVTANIDISRRHSELTPKLLIECEPGGQSVQMTIRFRGPAELRRLDELSVRIRDDHAWRGQGPSIAGGPVPSRQLPTSGARTGSRPGQRRQAVSCQMRRAHVHGPRYPCRRVGRVPAGGHQAAVVVTGRLAVEHRRAAQTGADVPGSRLAAVDFDARDEAHQRARDRGGIAASVYAVVVVAALVICLRW